jgi:hypothetical protein
MTRTCPPWALKALIERPGANPGAELAGFDDHLMKPVESLALKRALAGISWTD